MRLFALFFTLLALLATVVSAYVLALKIPAIACHLTDSLYSGGKRYIPNLLREVEA